jgi:hypothetical protein
MRHYYIAPLWFEILCWITSLVIVYYAVKYAM